MALVFGSKLNPTFQSAHNTLGHPKLKHNTKLFVCLTANEEKLP